MSSSSGRRPPRAKMNTATATTTIASVVSMNGAPRIAPTPMSSPAACPDAIAMIGRSVSGSAVPTAASTEPTAPSDRPKPSPTHSTPFVNSSAPAKITNNETTSSAQSIWLGMLPGLLGSPQAMTTPPAAARSDRDVRIRLAFGARAAHRTARALGPVDRPASVARGRSVAVRSRDRRRRVHPVVGRRGCAARHRGRVGARRARADRGAPRVRGRLRVRVEGRAGGRAVRRGVSERRARPRVAVLPRAREHDRCEPPADRHRVELGGVHRLVPVAQARGPDRARRRRSARSAWREPTRSRSRSSGSRRSTR